MVIFDCDWLTLEVVIVNAKRTALVKLIPYFVYCSVALYKSGSLFIELCHMRE